MPKKIFHESFGKFSKFTQICMENHSSMIGWQKLFFFIQILLIFGGRCNRYFWDIRLKIYRLPYFSIMLFQLVLTKVFNRELFPFLPKIDHQPIIEPEKIKSLPSTVVVMLLTESHFRKSLSVNSANFSQNFTTCESSFCFLSIFITLQTEPPFVYFFTEGTSFYTLVNFSGRITSIYTGFK